jgi:hypothetical protein
MEVVVPNYFGIFIRDTQHPIEYYGSLKDILRMKCSKYPERIFIAKYLRALPNKKPKLSICQNCCKELKLVKCGSCRCKCYCGYYPCDRVYPEKSDRFYRWTKIKAGGKNVKSALLRGEL